MSDPVDPTFTSPEVARMLARLNVVLIDKAGPIIASTGLYGIFITLSIPALYIQWNKHKSTPSTPNLIMMATAVVLIAFITVYLALKLFAFYVSFDVLLTSPSNAVYPLRKSPYESNAAMIWHFYASQVMRYATVWIADAILVWRACVIWSNDIKILVSLGTLLLFTFATTIWYLVVDYIYYTYSVDLEKSNSPSAMTVMTNERVANQTRLMASLCTNWFSTFAIAYQIWVFRSRILPQIQHTSSKGHVRVYGILTYLVEMGFFLGAYQLVLTTAGFDPIDANKTPQKVLAYNILFSCLPFIAGINPILTIILVNKHYSIAQSTTGLVQESKPTQSHSHSRDVRTGDQIEFTHRDSTLHESESYSTQ